MEFFTQKHKDETFAKNSNFFFSPILDVQQDIKYGQGAIDKFEVKSKVDGHQPMDVDEGNGGPSSAAAAGSGKDKNGKLNHNEVGDDDFEPV